MRRLKRRRRTGLAAIAGRASGERATVGLAVIALGPAVALIGGEVLRMARRRRESDETPTPENLVGAAGHATRDTLTVARRGIRATPHHETVLFNMLQGFLGAFAIARLSTWGVRRGRGPFRNVRISGRHIHHFIPGILLAFAAGAASIISRDEAMDRWFALPFGAGMALTLDEAALLVDLDDVYWSERGILSVQLTLGTMAGLGALAVGLRVLKRGEAEVLEPPATPSP
jgi:hypothetical protein